VRYPYGANILKKGHFYLPNKEGHLVPLSQQPTELKNKLGYNLDSNPITLVLKNSLELFFTLDDRIIPFYGLIPEGKIFGSWRMFSMSHSHHPRFVWDLTAGARSIFMLPKISEKTSHTRLRQALQINSEKPKTLLDHWEVFKQIANSSQNNDPWYTEVLFFTNKWLEHVDDPVWQPFNYYLLKISWQNSDFWRSEFIWNLVFSIIQKRKNIKPSAHIANIVKHLFMMAAGVVPGFAPAIDNQAAPIDFIQQVYLEHYRLRDYPPIIMQPLLFDMYNQSRPIYYSLQFPTSVEFSNKPSERSTVITDLYMVKSFLEKCLHGINLDDLNIKPVPLYALTKKVQFDHFHTDAQSYHGIRDSLIIPLEDKAFVPEKFKSKNFPVANTFVRGCVRIKSA